MKQFVKIDVFQFLFLTLLFSVSQCHPVEQNSCNFEHILGSFNLTLVILNPFLSSPKIKFKILFQLEGKWYDVAHSTFLFKENTWRNGLSVVHVEQNLQELEIVYSGLDNSNSCQISQFLRAKYTNGYSLAIFADNEYKTVGSLKILNVSNESVIVSICYDDSELSHKSCALNKLDLFVWSRSRLNTSSNTYRGNLTTLLEKFCVRDENDLVFSNLDESECTIESSVNVTNEQPVLVAELKINDGLLSSIESNFLNKTFVGPDFNITSNKTRFVLVEVNDSTISNFSVTILPENSTFSLNETVYVVNTTSQIDEDVILTEIELTSNLNLNETEQQIRFSALDFDENSGDVEESFSDILTTTPIISINETGVKLKKILFNLEEF